MNELLPLVAYFIIYSFIGWVLESTYKSVLQKRWVNSGFLHGPICPIYGYGAMIMYLSLRNLTDNIFILFWFGLIVLSAFEYVVGWFLEITFKTKYWDYSKKMFNIHGRVCLQNSLYWGALGVVFMKLIHPSVERIFGIIPDQYVLIIVSSASAIILVDTIITVIGLVKINIKLKNLEEITTAIRDRMSTINIKNVVNLEKIKQLQLRNNQKVLEKIGAIRNSESVLGELKKRQEYYQKVLEIAKAEGSEVLPICAELEAEIASLDKEEKEMFLSELGVESGGLDLLVKKSYALLGLISFLTSGPDECRAWTITKGTKAPQAAGKIHTDFERGFIRAEVIDFDTLIELGSMTAAKEKGLVRSEGKEYVMKDGDVVLFRFNV